MYEVLHKRKVFRDSFLEGLEVFDVKTGIFAFPDLFQELFVASSTCTSEDVIEILKVHGDGEVRVKEFLLNAIRKLNEMGKTCFPAIGNDYHFDSLFSELKDFLMCSTGSPYHTGNVVHVHFTSEVGLPAFSWGTCGPCPPWLLMKKAS